MSPDSQQDRTPFDMEIEIQAPRDAVWAALADARELTNWFAPEARIDAREGGEVEWTWEGLHSWPQRIEVFEPGTRLLTRYDSGVDDGKGGKKPLFIDFRLTGDGGSTTLRLVHSGFGPDSGFDREYDGISRGWPVELNSLRLYLERHAGEQRRFAWVTRSLDGGQQPAAAWDRLLSADGFHCDAGIDALAEGAPFSFVTADGDRFEGTALCCQHREFSGMVDNLGSAFLRIAVENCGGSWMVWLWLATYDRPAEEVSALTQRWEKMVDRLFQQVAAPTPPDGESA